MNHQEIFDKVSLHLLTQQKQAKRGIFCFYRLNDLKCAIGCLISDEEYNPSIEGAAGYELINDFIDHPIFNNLNLDLLDSLQNVHDNFPPLDWKNMLTVIADRYALNADVLNTDNLKEIEK